MPCLIPVVLIVLVPALWLIGTYNGLVRLRNHCREAWAGIDTEIKRRYDLIPNLVETVKGYARHEREVLESVVRARQQAVASTGSPESQAKDEVELVHSLKRLFALAESYPDLNGNRDIEAVATCSRSGRNSRPLRSRLVGEQVGRGEFRSRGAVEGGEDLLLRVLCQPAPLAGAGHHLERETAWRGRDQVRRLQPPFRHLRRNGLGPQVPLGHIRCFGFAHVAAQLTPVAAALQALAPSPPRRRPPEPQPTPCRGRLTPSARNHSQGLKASAVRTSNPWTNGAAQSASGTATATASAALGPKPPCFAVVLSISIFWSSGFFFRSMAAASRPWPSC